MGLFSKKKEPEPDRFDLAALGLPRVQPVSDLGVTSERMTVWSLTSCDDLARTMVPMSPFVLDVQGTPTILVKLAGLSAREAGELARAVEAGDSLAVAAAFSYPTYPVLVLSLFVYDTYDDPLRFEGFRDITTADVQDFAAGLDRTGGEGKVRLYDESAGLLAVGRFGLRMPPFSRTKFPYRSTAKDLNGFWQVLRDCAAWYHRVPAAGLDFNTAVDTHLATVPPL